MQAFQPFDDASHAQVTRQLESRQGGGTGRSLSRTEEQAVSGTSLCGFAFARGSQKPGDNTQRRRGEPRKTENVPGNHDLSGTAVPSTMIVEVSSMNLLCCLGNYGNPCVMFSCFASAALPSRKPKVTARPPPLLFQLSPGSMGRQALH